MLKSTKAAEAESKRVIAESLTSALGRPAELGREAVAAAVRAADPSARLVAFDGESATIEAPQAEPLRAVRFESER